MITSAYKSEHELWSLPIQANTVNQRIQVDIKMHYCKFMCMFIYSHFVMNIEEDWLLWRIPCN